MESEDKKRIWFTNPDRFTKAKKAVKEIMQVLADNDLTAVECRAVLKVAKYMFRDRPLDKDCAARFEERNDADLDNIFYNFGMWRNH